MQIAGPAGQMSEVKLVDNSLYVVNHLGSLRLSSSQTNLRDLRTFLERLFTIKSFLVAQKAYYISIEHLEQADKKSMEAKLNTLIFKTSYATIAPNIVILLALVFGTVVIARSPFLVQAIERFMFMLKPDSSTKTQLLI